MVGSFSDYIENLIDKFKWHLFMEKITHRINKEIGRFLSELGNVQTIWKNFKLKTVLIIRRSHCL